MTHRISWAPTLSMVLALGACGDNGVSGTDSATTGTGTDFSLKDTRTADVPDTGLVLGVDVNDDQTPDFTWDVPSTALKPALGGLVHVFAYSDAQGMPSLQVVAADGPARQLDPDPD